MGDGRRELAGRGRCRPLAFLGLGVALRSGVKPLFHDL